MGVLPAVDLLFLLPTKPFLVGLEYGRVFLFPTLLVGGKHGHACRVFGFVIVLNALQTVGVLGLAVRAQFGANICRGNGIVAGGSVGVFLLGQGSI